MCPDAQFSVSRVVSWHLEAWLHGQSHALPRVAGLMHVGIFGLILKLSHIAPAALTGSQALEITLSFSFMVPTYFLQKVQFV